MSSYMGYGEGLQMRGGDMPDEQRGRGVPDEQISGISTQLLSHPSAPVKSRYANGNTGSHRLIQEEGDMSDPHDGEGSMERSRTAQLWLQSRVTSSSKSPFEYRARGEDRPLTIANVKLAFQLVLHLWRPFLSLFWEGRQWRIIAFLFRKVIRGSIPAAKLWAQSQMLDVVQRSFESGQVDTAHVLRAAAISMILTASDDIYHFISSRNDNLIRTHINYTMEKAYLRSQLSLSIPSMSSPYLSALMYEAGVFAGFESRSTRLNIRTRSGGPFETLQAVFSLLTIIVEVITQLYLLLSTISSNTTEYNRSTILLIFLSLMPMCLRLSSTWLLRSHGQTRNGKANWRLKRQEEQDIKQMGRLGEYKQEVVLFGLKDWILERWDLVKVMQMNEQEEAKRNVGYIELGLGLGQQSVETAFYVLLALRTLSTSLTLGSIRLYQSTANSLLGSIRRFTYTLELAFQSMFYLAAFVEATTDPEGTELAIRRKRWAGEVIDYSRVREEGGMRIEAEGLNFTYPGSDKPVLRDINLSIKPGETLAIVGFNGGGKTTLVKALMGLYDHTGNLTINTHPIESYDPTTLQRYTSCLFQDFSKYTLSLRENVGIGNVERIDDLSGINAAIDLGGAEVVREKVGLEGKLNRSGVPDAAGGEGELEIVVDKGPKGRERDRGGREEGGKGGRGRDGGIMRGRGGGMIGDDGGLRRRGLAGSDRGLPPPGPPPPEMDVVPPPGFGNMHVVSESGSEDKKASLSGGQWQRVALSRAFLRADEADLIVFDEPSASLDPRAEAQLFQRIHALSTQNGRKVTTIYISHRFSTVRKADQIAVVEDGTIVEKGSHTELMALGGRYCELFNLQKEGFED